MGLGAVPLVLVILLIIISLAVALCCGICYWNNPLIYYYACFLSCMNTREMQAEYDKQTSHRRLLLQANSLKAKSPEGTVKVSEHDVTLKEVVLDMDNKTIEAPSSIEPALSPSSSVVRRNSLKKEEEDSNIPTSRVTMSGVDVVSFVRKQQGSNVLPTTNKKDVNTSTRNLLMNSVPNSIFVYKK